MRRRRASVRVDRFMLHLMNDDFVPQDAPELLRRARRICSGMDATLRDVRVSSRYIEYDVSVAKELMELLVSRLEPIGRLDHARHLIEEEIERERAVLDGISYFNDERFWEAHEALEGVWKRSLEGERDLVQGIILVAAAFVHYQKNENRICLSIMGRALAKLSSSGGTYFGIDVDKLRSRVLAMRNPEEIRTFTI